MSGTASTDESRLVSSKNLLLGFSVGFVLVGIGLRLLRLGLNFPMWGDEAFVALNFFDSDFATLTKPLRHYQIAPLGFLWLEKITVLLLGMSEFTLRLTPCLAGIFALLVSFKAAKNSTPPKTALLSLAMIAVSYYPIRHSCEVKPYAFDFLAASLFLWLGSTALKKTATSQPIYLLAIFSPILLFTSFPAAFSAGGVCIALAFHIFQHKKYALITPCLVLICSVLASFLAHYAIIGSNQFHNELAKHQAYWDSTFPPNNLFQLPLWLLKTHAGNLSAYPIGGKDGASSLTLLFFLLGIFKLARNSKFSLLILLLAPFALNMIAAFMGRYPYGGSARVAQHLLPSICILSALGIRSILQLHLFATIRSKAYIGLLCCLILLAIFQAGRDVKKPYKSLGDLEARAIIQELCSSLQPDESLLITQEKDQIDPTLEWHLRIQKNKILWTTVDMLPTMVAQKKQSLWLWLPNRPPGGDTLPTINIPIFNGVQTTIKKDFSFALGRDNLIKPQMVLVQLKPD